MQRFDISFWPIDNNAMGGVSFQVECGGLPVDDQWVKDLADAMVPLIPTTALGWTSAAKVDGITIHDSPRSVSPNP